MKILINKKKLFKNYSKITSFLEMLIKKIIR